MTRDQFEHAVRAACDLTRESEVIIIGSQAILGAHPDASEFLRQSTEIDLIVKNRPELADNVEGVLGEFSLFHQTHGFYVQGLTIEAATLPRGWESRLVRVSNVNTRGCTAWCLETHDLAASKLKAFRDKDKAFVRALLAERLVHVETLTERLGTLEISEELRARLLIWTSVTGRELGMQPVAGEPDAD
jgi:hypothetical protein